MKILITGGAGFIGSHIARFYEKDNQVIVYDNLSRRHLLRKDMPWRFNWIDLENHKNIKLINGDILDVKQLDKHMKKIDTIFHMAGQTGVTSSMKDPKTDFEINCKGTFNILEAARKHDVKNIIYASTNKVYGDNVNLPPKNGIPETFSIDNCEHTPYGCSKLTGDLYTQDYGYLYGIKIGVFRMSCIYGTHQLGVEDQGWVAWFTIATLLDKPITIYGNGKQVRDVLWVYDLIDAYDKFLKSKYKVKVYNIGGGTKNTLSLLKLVYLLKKMTSKQSKITYADRRPADQDVYISDIRKISKELKWEPKIDVNTGLSKLIRWVEENKAMFKKQ